MKGMSRFAGPCPGTIRGAKSWTGGPEGWPGSPVTHTGVCSVELWAELSLSETEGSGTGEIEITLGGR